MYMQLYQVGQCLYSKNHFIFFQAVCLSVHGRRLRRNKGEDERWMDSNIGGECVHKLKNSHN